MDAHQPEGAPEGTGDPIPPSEGNLVLGILQQYGWFLVLGAVALYFLWEKIQPKLHQFQRDREERNLKKYDSNTAQKRMEQMDQARQRLQQQYDAQAQTFAEFQRQKEEEKRKERIEDWDRHLQGKGYRNKYRPEENPTKTSPPSKKPEKKTPLRPSDFNPLMGSGGGSYRPPTRRTGGG